MTLAATSSEALAGPEDAATVLSIGDGDTIRVQQGAKRITIRLACIDAPEMAQTADGANARSSLQSRLRLGSSVTLKAQTVDRFRRTVPEVIGEVNLNLALGLSPRQIIGAIRQQHEFDSWWPDPSLR